MILSSEKGHGMPWEVDAPYKAIYDNKRTYIFIAVEISRAICYPLRERLFCIGRRYDEVMGDRAPVVSVCIASLPSGGQHKCLSVGRERNGSIRSAAPKAG